MRNRTESEVGRLRRGQNKNEAGGHNDEEDSILSSRARYRHEQRRRIYFSKLDTVRRLAANAGRRGDMVIPTRARVYTGVDPCYVHEAGMMIHDRVDLVFWIVVNGCHP